MPIHGAFVRAGWEVKYLGVQSLPHRAMYSGDGGFVTIDCSHPSLGSPNIPLSHAGIGQRFVLLPFGVESPWLWGSRLVVCGSLGLLVNGLENNRHGGSLLTDLISSQPDLLSTEVADFDSRYALGANHGVLEENIKALEVAMDDPLAVQVAHS